jgi:hypothetical protein
LDVVQYQVDLRMFKMVWMILPGRFFLPFCRATPDISNIKTSLQAKLSSKYPPNLALLPLSHKTPTTPSYTWVTRMEQSHFGPPILRHL